VQLLKGSYLCGPQDGEVMLIIPVKEGENIERALKKYKKKFDRTGTMRALRKRKHFVKPSVANRKQMLKAAYKLKKFAAEE
jgi:small subunit ribosomal protein S21